jgi:hypothetical protein
LRTIRIRTEPIDETIIDDCLLIQNILIDRGYYATLEQRHIMWKMHSECYAASWLNLYENKESVYDAISTYFEADKELHQD